MSPPLKGKANVLLMRPTNGDLSKAYVRLRHPWFCAANDRPMPVQGSGGDMKSSPKKTRQTRHRQSATACIKSADENRTLGCGHGPDSRLVKRHFTED